MPLARNVDNHNNGKEPGYDEWKKEKVLQRLESAKKGNFATDAEVEAAFRSFSQEN